MSCANNRLIGGTKNDIMQHSLNSFVFTNVTKNANIIIWDLNISKILGF